jgi:hypothetical protein
LFKNVCIFQGKQPYFSKVVEFQSSSFDILARTNTIALNTTLNRMKLHDSPVCEACHCNATELLQHFLVECPAYRNMRSMSLMLSYFPVFFVVTARCEDKMVLTDNYTNKSSHTFTFRALVQ